MNTTITGHETGAHQNQFSDVELSSRRFRAKPSALQLCRYCRCCNDDQIACASSLQPGFKISYSLMKIEIDQRYESLGV
jgi:hypothetical protein